jgi:hypothetical protein
MNTLQKLKFVSSKRVTKTYGKATPAQRRTKLAARIDEQIAIATADQQGKEYTVMQSKTVKDKLTGNISVVNAAKKIKRWYWTDSTGKICVEIFYGTRVLEISKGTNAIQLADLKEMVATLTLIKNAAMLGELDKQLATTAHKQKKSA